MLGHHVLDFWTNVCLCHSLIVERPGDNDDDEPTDDDAVPSSIAGRLFGSGAANLLSSATAGLFGGSAASGSRPASARTDRTDGGGGADGDGDGAGEGGDEGDGELLPPPPPPMPTYQGPSPDEVALADAARRLGFEFVGRTRTTVNLRVQGHDVTHTLLNVLDFTSERARMSVIARAPDGTIRLHCKGSDTALAPRLRARTDARLLSATQENLRLFSVQGLRTLLLASRVVPEDEWAVWNARYQAAAATLAGRDAALAAAADEVERDLELVGVTAIEDKLQEGVPDAIRTLIQAGIKASGRTWWSSGVSGRAGLQGGGVRAHAIKPSTPLPTRPP